MFGKTQDAKPVTDDDDDDDDETKYELWRRGIEGWCGRFVDTLTNQKS